MSDKAQAEHNESACSLIADMTADIDFCRFGPILLQKSIEAAAEQ